MEPFFAHSSGVRACSRRERAYRASRFASAKTILTTLPFATILPLRTLIGRWPPAEPPAGAHSPHPAWDMAPVEPTWTGICDAFASTAPRTRWSSVSAPDGGAGDRLGRHGQGAAVESSRDETRAPPVRKGHGRQDGVGTQPQRVSYPAAYDHQDTSPQRAFHSSGRRTLCYPIPATRGPPPPPLARTGPRRSPYWVQAKNVPIPLLSAKWIPLRHDAAGTTGRGLVCRRGGRGPPSPTRAQPALQHRAWQPSQPIQHLDAAYTGACEPRPS